MQITIKTQQDKTIYQDQVAVKDLLDSGVELSTWIALGVIPKESEAKVSKLWGGWNDLGSSGSEGYSRIGNRPITDLSLLSEYQNNPLAFTCINMNATAVAATDWNVCAISDASNNTATTKNKHKHTKRKSVSKSLRKQAAIVSKSTEADIVAYSDHPLYDLINTDNRDINGSQLIKLTQGYLETLGRAYWYVDDNEITGKKRITLLKPQSVIPLRDTSGYVVGYNYFNYVEGYIVAPTDASGADLTKVVRIDADQVIDFRNAPLTDPYGGGLSPLRAGMKAVYQSSIYTDWLNNALSNRQRMDWLLIPKLAEGQAMGRDEKDRLYKDIDLHLGGRNNGKPLILESAMQAVPMSFAPTDLAGLAINAEVQKLLCNAHDVPPALLDKDANYANMEASLELWSRRGVAPRVILLQQTLNENLWKLGIEDDDCFIVFDNPIPEDEQFELEQKTANAQILQIAAAAQVPMTDNEKRALVGLEPLADPAANEIEDEPEEPQAPVTTAPLPTASDNGDNDRLLKINSEVAKGRLTRSVAISLVERLGFADAKQLVGFATEGKGTTAPCSCGACKSGGTTHNGGVQVEEKTVARIKTAVARWFNDLRKDCLKQITKSAPEGIITKTDTGIIPPSFGDVETWANELRGTDDDLAYKVKPLLEMQAQKVADNKTDYLTQLGASPDAFEVVPHEVSKAVDKRSYKFAQSTLQTTQASVKQVVEGVRKLVGNSVEAGDSNDLLAEKLGEFFEDASDYQAERIARTEASAAVHSGQVIAAKASGIVKGFKYIVGPEECDVCAPYEGQEVDIGDYDDSGAVDSEGAVPLHPNCRCTLAEIIDTDALTEGDN